MSIKYPLKNLGVDQRKLIADKLIFCDDDITVEPWDMDDEYIYLPIHFTLENISGSVLPPRKSFPPTSLTFKGTLRKIQQEVKPEILASLKKRGVCVLSLYPGAGKSALSVKLAVMIKLKTLVIVKGKMLLDQWSRVIPKFCDGTVQILKPKSKVDKTMDFYIINLQNIPKFTRDDFSHIGFLIADEIHTLMSPKHSKGFTWICPRYAVALSATAFRYDGLDDLINCYFSDKRIHKQLYRKHRVYRIKTGISYPIEFNAMGGIDWSKILNNQAEHNARNDLIVNIITTLKNRTFLVLCKRLFQIRYLTAKLEKLGETVTFMDANHQDFDRDARILIATIDKCGTGFDHDKLDTLIVAADAKHYPLQFLGRVFRTEEGVPYVFDLMDDGFSMENHFRERGKVYRKCGGKIIYTTSDKIINLIKD